MLKLISSPSSDPSLYLLHSHCQMKNLRMMTSHYHYQSWMKLVLVPLILHIFAPIAA